VFGLRAWDDSGNEARDEVEVVVEAADTTSSEALNDIAEWMQKGTRSDMAIAIRRFLSRNPGSTMLRQLDDHVRSYPSIRWTIGKDGELVVKSGMTIVVVLPDNGYVGASLKGLNSQSRPRSRKGRKPWEFVVNTSDVPPDEYRIRVVPQVKDVSGKARDARSVRGRIEVVDACPVRIAQPLNLASAVGDDLELHFTADSSFPLDSVSVLQGNSTIGSCNGAPWVVCHPVDRTPAPFTFWFKAVDTDGRVFCGPETTVFTYPALQSDNDPHGSGTGGK